MRFIVSANQIEVYLQNKSRQNKNNKQGSVLNIKFSDEDKAKQFLKILKNKFDVNGFIGAYNEVVRIDLSDSDKTRFLSDIKSEGNDIRDYILNQLIEVDKDKILINLKNSIESKLIIKNMKMLVDLKKGSEVSGNVEEKPVISVSEKIDAHKGSIEVPPSPSKKRAAIGSLKESLLVSTGESEIAKASEKDSLLQNILGINPNELMVSFNPEGKLIKKIQIGDPPLNLPAYIDRCVKDEIADLNMTHLINQHTIVQTKDEIKSTHKKIQRIKDEDKKHKDEIEKGMGEVEKPKEEDEKSKLELEKKRQEELDRLLNEQKANEAKLKKLLDEQEEIPKKIKHINETNMYLKNLPHLQKEAKENKEIHELKKKYQLALIGYKKVLDEYEDKSRNNDNQSNKLHALYKKLLQEWKKVKNILMKISSSDSKLSAIIFGSNDKMKYLVGINTILILDLLKFLSKNSKNEDIVKVAKEALQKQGRSYAKVVNDNFGIEQIPFNPFDDSDDNKKTFAFRLENRTINIKDTPEKQIEVIQNILSNDQFPKELSFEENEKIIFANETKEAKQALDKIAKQLLLNKDVTLAQVVKIISGIEALGVRPVSAVHELIKDKLTMLEKGLTINLVKLSEINNLLKNERDETKRAILLKEHADTLSKFNLLKNDFNEAVTIKKPGKPVSYLEKFTSPKIKFKKEGYGSKAMKAIKKMLNDTSNSILQPANYQGGENLSRKDTEIENPIDKANEALLKEVRTARILLSTIISPEKPSGTANEKAFDLQKGKDILKVLKEYEDKYKNKSDTLYVKDKIIQQALNDFNQYSTPGSARKAAEILALSKEKNQPQPKDRIDPSILKPVESTKSKLAEPKNDVGNHLDNKHSAEKHKIALNTVKPTSASGVNPAAEVSNLAAEKEKEKKQKVVTFSEKPDIITIPSSTKTQKPSSVTIAPAPIVSSFLLLRNAHVDARKRAVSTSSVLTYAEFEKGCRTAEKKLQEKIDQNKSDKLYEGITIKQGFTVKGSPPNPTKIVIESKNENEKLPAHRMVSVFKPTDLKAAIEPTTTGEIEITIDPNPDDKILYQTFAFHKSVENLKLESGCNETTILNLVKAADRAGWGIEVIQKEHENVWVETRSQDNKNKLGLTEEDYQKVKDYIARVKPHQSLTGNKNKIDEYEQIFNKIAKPESIQSKPSV